jgi:hypothetical protein
VVSITVGGKVFKVSPDLEQEHIIRPILQSKMVNICFILVLQNCF